MHIPFVDFFSLHEASVRVEARAFVIQEGRGCFRLVQSGEIFNRSADPRYVLDNLRSRVTHVEIEEQGLLRDSLSPKLKESLLHSTINIPPEEFFLMQDIYQLPDTGDWNTGREVLVTDFRLPPPVTQHALVDQHEGVLINTVLINLLRSRTSYVRSGDLFVRSRDTQFLVRRRTLHVLLVVDDPPARESIAAVMEPSPDFLIHYYVLTEQGIRLAELDRGDREHIGLMHYISESGFQPAMILFPAHRTVQLEKTRAAIQTSQDRLGGTAALKKMICGQIGPLIDQGRIVDEIHTLTKGISSELSVMDKAGDSIRIKRKTGELNFSYRHLILQFRFICQSLALSEERIAELIQPAQQKANSTVRILVESKWLPAAIGSERYAELGTEQRAQAVTNYISRYAERVQNVRNAIRFELLMKTTLDLCCQGVAGTGERISPQELDLLRAESSDRAIRRLRELYTEELPEGVSDVEIADLYRHDFNKLVTIGLIDTLVERLAGASPAPSS